MSVMDGRGGGPNGPFDVYVPQANDPYKGVSPLFVTPLVPRLCR